MRKVAILGVGHTPFTFLAEKTAVELFSEASMEAINQSNLKVSDIQAMFVGNVLGDFSEGQGMIQSYAADEIGAKNIPASRFEGACASGTMAIRDAFMWVTSGFYDIVIAGGVDTVSKMGTPLATRTFAMFTDAHYEYPSGLTFPGAFAMLAHLYSAKYSITLSRLKQQMAMVSVQSHKYGNYNHLGQLHKVITIDDVLNSGMVTSPLQLNDCCPFSDGAAAMILASEEIAKRLTDKPVYITGLGQASSGRFSAQKEYLPRLYARDVSVRQAYAMAGITPKDVDLCELHDCFSIASIIAAESLGFAEFGHGGELWEKGEADIKGRIPINMSGGLKSKGHPLGATGAAQAIDIVKQMRELVEQERQVEDVKVGLTDTLGGDGIICNLVLQRGW
ncbi:MAG: propanoyl-CoA acyltransferase [Chloroflexi bacterium HGW-Chloroflexi-5]|jgi:acetyl-CoA C-acetyltransferase/acetyl-CoA acyltransferase|nr:MAG: propanoyl-CoA acyltransferase [Deltaproteobacteria bacterium HGW-Deltaproteobacteria-12]PKN96156.1 MAG: propanoyl-CoA acyltransferase [Chloroflexi bacterium HGW-Chloroflexi-5]